MLKQLATFSGFTLVSRILGMFREILIAYALGAGFWSDVFFIAFRFPSFFRKFFAEGAMQGALVPEIASTNSTKIAGQMFWIMASSMFCFVLIVELFAPNLISILAPGYVTDPEKKTVAIQFIRITFPTILAISLSAIFAAVLNSKQKFAAESSAPVIMNIVMISVLLISFACKKNVAYALIWSTLVASILHCLYVYAFCHAAGFRLHSPQFAIPDNLKRVLKTMGINSLSGAVMQINIFVDMMLASWMPAGSLSFLVYADRIFQLPLSVIGVAMSSVLLPNFSRINDRPVEQQNLLKNSLRMAFQIAAPAAVGMSLFSDFIIYTLFCRGEFLASHSCTTGNVLLVCGVSLPAYVMGKILNSYCYAQKKPWIPFRASLVSVCANIIGSLILMNMFECVGLAMATSIAAWLNVSVLLFSVFGRQVLSWARTLIPSVLWLAIHGLGLYAYKLQMNFQKTHWAISLATFFCIVIVFMISYFGLGHHLKIQNFFYKFSESNPSPTV